MLALSPSEEVAVLLMSCLSSHSHDVVKDLPVKNPGSDITGRCKNKTAGNAREKPAYSLVLISNSLLETMW